MTFQIIGAVALVVAIGGSAWWIYRARERAIRSAAIGVNRNRPAHKLDRIRRAGL